MTLLRVKSTLLCKLAFVSLCLFISMCYGDETKESIPSKEISSKEEIYDQSLLSYDYLIEDDISPFSEVNTPLEQVFFISHPTPEETSEAVLNTVESTLPISLNDEVRSEQSPAPSDDSSLHLFAENLPKPHLSISTKSAEAIPAFTPVAEHRQNKNSDRKLSRGPSKPINQVDLFLVFAAAPWIYSILAILFVFAFSLGFYNLNHIRKSLRTNEPLLNFIIPKLEQHEFDDVILHCEKDSRLLSRLIATSVHCRTWGLPAMLEHMKSEGRRYTQTIWHRIGLLSDVAMIAPLLGLLGTVMGMFYAFNDVSRSANSLLQFMDGLGVSIGTTVAGLLVAISAITFQTICRDRLARAVVRVEQNALDVARLVDRKSGL